MSRKFLILVLLILTGISFTYPQVLYGNVDVKGIWQGSLKVSGTELRIVFKISMGEGDALTATMDSPDQGAIDIPVDEVIVEGDNLTLKVKSIGGVYEGKLQENGSEVVGQWKQSGFSFPLVLERVEKVPLVSRPQEPKKPYPYDEEEVFYENEDADIKLAGTLTMPHTGGSFPAVILISGSGPQDRNETVFGHRPFLILSDYLTRRGIAVLRVDDRGVGESTGSSSESTSEDFADDVLAGIGYLKTRKEIDPEKIGLIGHSEGGIIAPMVASESPDVAFILLMAGTGLTGERILYLQSELIGKAEGATEEAIEDNRREQERIFSILKEEKDNTVAEKEIRKILEDALASLSEEEKQKMNLSPEELKEKIDTQVKQLLSPWLRFFLTYDPKVALKKIKCPVLAINGEKDLQVPPKENLNAIREALKAGGSKDYTVKELPGLNHLFQTAESGTISEYAKIEETISPATLKLIGDWILKRVK